MPKKSKKAAAKKAQGVAADSEKEPVADASAVSDAPDVSAAAPGGSDAATNGDVSHGTAESGEATTTKEATGAEQEPATVQDSPASVEGEVEAKAKADEEARANAAAEEKGKAEAEAAAKEAAAKAKAEEEAEAKKKAEAEAAKAKEKEEKAEAEAAAKAKEAEAKAKAEAEAKKKAEEEAKAKAEAEATARKKDAARKKAEADRAQAEARARAEEEARKAKEEEAKVAAEAKAKEEAAKTEAEAERRKKEAEEQEAKARLEAEVQRKKAEEEEEAAAEAARAAKLSAEAEEQKRKEEEKEEEGEEEEVPVVDPKEVDRIEAVPDDGEFCTDEEPAEEEEEERAAEEDEEEEKEDVDEGAKKAKAKDEAKEEEEGKEDKEDKEDKEEEEGGAKDVKSRAQMDPEHLMAVLGELPPDFEVKKAKGRKEEPGDSTYTDGEVADADPSFNQGSDEDEDEDEDEGGEEDDADEVKSTGTGKDVAAVSFIDMNKAATEKKEGGTLDGVLTPNQRASVAELFAKKIPEKMVDFHKKLGVVFLITDHESFPIYHPCEDSSWLPHRASLRHESRRPGIKAHIVRTESRGPKSAMYTTYVIHVKTAFHVRGVSRRFSDFAVLDRKLRAKYPNAPELVRTNRILGTLSPGFVQERRQQLQDYLDALLANHQLAHSDIARNFLALHGVMQDTASMPQPAPESMSGGAKEEGIEQEETFWEYTDNSLAEFLSQLSQCKSARDAPQEARLLNKVGLIMCEKGKQTEGIVHLQRAVSSSRLVNDRRSLLRCLSNLACAHFKFGGRLLAVELLEEAIELAQRLGDARAEAGCLRVMALAQAADGDMAQGLKRMLEAGELYASVSDVRGQAATKFCEGVMQYDLGNSVEGVTAMEKSLVLRRTLKDKIGIAEVLNRLGLALVDIGYHLQALDYFERALALCQEEGDVSGEASTLRLLAYVHFAQVDGDRKMSLQLFERSLALARANADVSGQATCHEGVADVLMDMDDSKLALEHYSQALLLRETRVVPADPQAHTRHIQLLRSKLSRAKAQVLEASEGMSDAEGGDFLWRNNAGLGALDSDGELAPIAEGVENRAAPQIIDTGIAYYKELATNAVSMALTKLWS